MQKKCNLVGLKWLSVAFDKPYFYIKGLTKCSDPSGALLLDSSACPEAPIRVYRSDPSGALLLDSNWCLRAGTCKGVITMPWAQHSL